jgi:predicted HicB family RNase H-like nuclease
MPEGEAMDRQLTCRVRRSEEAAMKAAAAKAGLSLAQWMRQVLLRAAGGTRPRGLKPPKPPGA